MYIACEKTNSAFFIRKLEGELANCEKIPFKAELFLETSGKTNYSGFKTNRPLKQFEFDSIEKYNEFKEKFSDRIYGDIDPIYQQLSTTNPNIEEIKKITSWSIDIEVYSETEFPYPNLANKYPITVISLTNFKTQESYTWLYDINKLCTLKSEKDFNIKIFFNELEMFKDFTQFFKQNLKSIHVLTGWNSIDFDIPYLIHRMNFLENDDIHIISDLAKALSPFKNITYNDREKNFMIKGLPHYDYLQLFKKFGGNYGSYKLEEICQEELGHGKVDHSEYASFAEFYNQDVNEFVRYNKDDSRLVKELDDKFKYIPLAISIAYMCKIPFEKIYSPIRCWEALIYNELKKKNIVLFPRKRETKEDYQGAFVKEPSKGMKMDILSYDLTSLYPSVIQAMNISNETLIEYETDTKATIESFVSGYIPEDYHKKNMIVDAAGNIFSKEQIGIIPQLMETIFNRRLNLVNQIKEITTEIDSLKEQLKECESV